MSSLPSFVDSLELTKRFLVSKQSTKSVAEDSGGMKGRRKKMTEASATRSGWWRGGDGTSGTHRPEAPAGQGSDVGLYFSRSRIRFQAS